MGLTAVTTDTTDHN